MSDTYRGESIGKKFARLIYWRTVKTWFGVERFVSGKHLFLASREGGDAAALYAFGVPFENMIAVDREKEAIQAFSDVWPDVPAFHDEASEVARQFRKRLLSVTLDFCTWATEDVLDTAATCAMNGLNDGGVLSVWTMRGRENKETMEAIRDAVVEPYRTLRPEGYTEEERQRIHRKSARTSFIDQSLVGRMIGARAHPCVMSKALYHSGRTPMQWDLFSIQRGMPGVSLKKFSRSVEAVALRTLHDLFTMRRFMFGEEPLKEPMFAFDDIEFFPDSSVPILNGSSFPTASGRLTWPTMFDVDVEDNNTMLAHLLDHAEKLVGKDRAHLLINISKGKAAALKAHLTMGTYSKRTA